MLADFRHRGAGNPFVGYSTVDRSSLNGKAVFIFPT
jgi:hypothetical protein